MTRLDTTFLALVIVQGAHSIEEYVGRLWEVFPPATFLTGLISEDRRLGFMILNVALFAFGLWSFLWPVRRQWLSARPLMGARIVLELVNGVGHPLWSLARHDYTPGVVTDPWLLLLALSLTRQLRSSAEISSVP